MQKKEENFTLIHHGILKSEEICSFDLKNMTIVSNFGIPIILKSKEKFIEYKNRFIKNHIEIRPILSGNTINQPFFKKFVRQYTCP